MTRYDVITDSEELGSRLDEISLPNETASYKPVPYHDLINWATQALDMRGMDTQLEGVQLVKDGAQMFGTWTVKPKDTDEWGEEFRQVLGLRSSYDKTLPCGVVMGVQVMVCSNLMFSGNIKATHRHTKNVYDSLPWEIHKLVESYLDRFTSDVDFLNNLKTVELVEKERNDFIVKAMEDDIITTSQVQRVVSECQAPSFPEFEEHRDTLYGLHNAFTHSFKRANPTTVVARNVKLNRMINNYWEPQLN